MNVKRKLILSGAVQFLFVCVLGGVSYLTLSRIVDVVNKQVIQYLEFLGEAYRIKQLILEHRRYEKDFFLNIGDRAEQKKYLDRFHAVAKEMATLFLRVKKTGKSQVLQVEENYKIYHAGFLEVAKRVLTSEDITIREANHVLMGKFKSATYAMEEGIDSLMQSESSQMNRSFLEVEKIGKQAILVLGIFVLVLLVLLVLYLTGTIAKRVEKFRSFCSVLRSGDLSARFEVSTLAMAPPPPRRG